ncbi:MAG: hypothetical protein LBK53_08090 [Heliobacteriaceae bacterium]|jgi:hypothetical protein|nr:hypothetical protein [Heliobacteriaceae bacterium]
MEEITQETQEDITQDIPPNISQDISSKAEYEQQPVQSSDLQDAVKKAAADDMLKIRQLMQAGIIAPPQGQNLMNQIVQRAYDVITNQRGTAVQAVPNVEFFNREGRSDVLDYLKKSNVVDKDEIFQITKMVEKIEQTAVNNYLEKMRREKTLNDENEAAKQRLKVNAQKTGSGGNLTTVFTRGQIGKMSGAEFAKYERAIMEQLRKGLIR